MHTEIADLFRVAGTGDPAASDQLFAALYDELHRIAERQIHRHGADLTLGATTLLHEAYLNIAERAGTEFASREHFMGYAARAMRGLIIDYSRRQRAVKRGGEFHITGIDDNLYSNSAPSVDHKTLEELGLALEELATVEPRLASIVDLHFFCGFDFTEIAVLRGVSERTVQRDWRKARLLLHNVLRDETPSDAIESP
jgi:RNA polymerase sigma factor (TIGR02999 family)